MSLCENCEDELISDANGNLIEVSENPMPPSGGMIFDIMPASEIEGTLKFCSLHCLKEWALYAEPAWKIGKL